MTTSSEKTYKTPQAMWTAVTARAKAAAAASGQPVNEVVREFLYERLLDRVFALPEAPWVLKGGTALLVRVEDARHSKDVDLLYRIADLDEAVEQLRAALALDRGDRLSFTVTKIESTGGGQQPGVAGLQVNIEIYAGLKKVGSFHIDLVTGSLMTAEPDERVVTTVVDVPGVVPPTVRLYPIVDHVADKLCATEATYLDGKPSSRVRDLVDLVVIARTETMSLRALRDAIASERHHRDLPSRETFSVPATWTDRYSEVSGSTRHCAGLDFAAAVGLVAQFLAPALVVVSGEDQTWSPTAAAWVRDDALV